MRLEDCGSVQPDIDQDGFPKLLCPPLTCLADDLCLRPALLGHLVPQQINLWLGCAKKGVEYV